MSDIVENIVIVAGLCLDWEVFCVVWVSLTHSTGTGADCQLFDFHLPSLQ